MRRNEYFFDLVEWLTEPPSGGLAQMWGVGGGLSAVFVAYGLYCVLAQHATTLNITMRGIQPLSRGLLIDIYGVQAVSFGLAIICIGLFTHFQWFWGNQKRLVPFYEIAKYGAALGFLAAIVAHVFTMIGN